ncbi:MAG TPA: FecR family protein [Puia sp.]|jgi:ferric-dicitrate binding protein FerR (iron transport regulator)|nr:FecR family protein [Puia sp.]
MIRDNDIEKLITKFFSGEALPEEAMALEDWVNHSPANRLVFNQYSTFFTMPIDISDIEKAGDWKKISDVIQEGKSGWWTKLNSWRLAGIAASIVVIVAVGLLARHSIKKEDGTIIYETGTATKQFVFRDRSEVTLLPNSFLTIDKGYGIHNRKMKLNGSAVFSVIHDPKQELIIDVGGFYIKDIGTKFTVVTAPTSDTISVAVAWGEISVYDDFGLSQRARAGEKVFYSKLRKRLLVLPARADSAGELVNPGPSGGKTEKMDRVKDKPSAPTAAGERRYGYPSTYPLDRGYTEPGKWESRVRDSTEMVRVVSDFLKDGLIAPGQPVSFTLSDTAFVLNGRKQSDRVFQRYRKKYVPAGKAGIGWVWSRSPDPL